MSKNSRKKSVEKRDKADPIVREAEKLIESDGETTESNNGSGR